MRNPAGPATTAPATYLQILPEFFRNFWVRRMALDRRNYRALVETTVEIALKVGGRGLQWVSHNMTGLLAPHGCPVCGACQMCYIQTHTHTQLVS